jgi:hypothetical protein
VEITGSKFSYDDCVTERRGPYKYTDENPDKGIIFRDPRLRGCPDVGLQPLTNDKSLLNAAIDKMKAGGYTAGHIGIQWSWYTISPYWASLYPAESRPGEYTNEINKFAVIMTDGEFNTAYDGVSRSVNRQNAKSAEYALKLCDNMKAAGIRIFTIGFALRDRNAIETMQKCASPATGGNQYFYSAATGSELAAVYDRIADQIQMVRLTR